MKFLFVLLVCVPCLASAAMEPIAMPPDCDYLLGNRRGFVIHAKDLPEVTPTLVTALERAQPILMFIYPAKDGPQFTKEQMAPLKKQIKKLGGFSYPVTGDYVNYWSVQINPNLATLQALPALLAELNHDSIFIQIQDPAPALKTKPVLKKTARKKSETPVVKSAGRHFTPISITELQKKIPADVLDFRDLSKTLARDLSKVEFDGENQVFDTADRPDLETLIGYQSLPGGLTFLGVIAGGDSDLPVFFAVYWDGNALRAYIPKDGNLWNPKTKAPYGSDPIDDVEYLRAIDPDRYKNMADDELLTSLNFDIEKIKADMIARLRSQSP